MSIFLGSQLEDVVGQLEKGAASGSKKGGSVTLGVTSLPELAEGRHRPQPDLAVRLHRATSSSSARSARRPRSTGRRPCSTRPSRTRLKGLADALDKLKTGDFDGLTRILSGIAKDNKQVLFEGNGYSEEWHAEAASRGLPNNRTTVDALPSLTTNKAKKLFAGFGVLSERELTARAEINWERYVKVCNIEASTALDIAKTMILPAAISLPRPAQRGRLVQGRDPPVPRRWPATRTSSWTRIHALEHAPARGPRSGRRHRRGEGLRRAT